MSKTKKHLTETEEKQLFLSTEDHRESENENIENVVESNMLEYGNYINTQRSIPFFIGLKVSQIRALYTFLYENKINSNVKLAFIVGACLGKFHPHGDTSVAETIHNLIQSWKNGIPLLEGQGNFGGIDGSPPAAVRYVEVRMMQKIKDLLFDNIYKNNVVKWIKNYDQSILEPKILPVKLPLHLINGASGIGYNTATSIPSFNVNEIINCMIYMIDKKMYNRNFNINEHIDNLRNIIKAPDFPTKCNVFNKNGDYLLDSKFSTGMQAEFNLDEKNSIITITGTPYDVSLKTILDEIRNLALTEIEVVETNKKKTKIQKDESEILKLIPKPSSVIDLPIREKGKKTDLSKIILQFKKDADLNLEKMKLLKYTSLSTVFSSNIVIVNEDGLVEEVSVLSNLLKFLDFRCHVIYNAKLHDINDIKEQIHIYEGYKEILVCNNIDKFLNIVKESVDLKEDLKNNYPKLTTVQLDNIVDMKITKLTRLAIDELEQKIKSDNEKISEIESLIINKESVFKLVKNELKEIQTSLFKNISRNSKIIDDSGKFKEEDFITDKPVVVFITENNTIGYKDSNARIRKNRGGLLTKDNGINISSGFDGKIIEVYEGLLKDECFFFTNKGRIFKNKIFKFTKKFVNIKNYFNLNADENIVKIISSDDFNSLNNAFIITKYMIKNQNLRINSFDSVTSNSGKKAISLKDGDSVISVIPHDQNNEGDLILITEDGGILRFDKNDVKEVKSNSSIGRSAIDSKSNILSANLILNNNDNNSSLLLVSNLGKGKIVKLDTISRKSVGQKPVQLFNNDKNNGEVIKSYLLEKDVKYKLSMITNEGNCSELAVHSDMARQVSRTAKSSIILLNLTEKQKIVFTTLINIDNLEQNNNTELEKGENNE